MRLGDYIIDKARKRRPDFVIGGRVKPYVHRWFLVRWRGLYRDVTIENKSFWQRFVSRLPGAYLHQIMRSDDDRALHDHPWCNVSIILRGCYTEHTIDVGGIHVRKLRTRGAVVFRWAKHAHRLEVHNGVHCWSLFLHGFRTRHWGFHCPERGWVPWKDFTNPSDKGLVGKGCEE